MNNDFLPLGQMACVDFVIQAEDYLIEEIVKDGWESDPALYLLAHAITCDENGLLTNKTESVFLDELQAHLCLVASASSLPEESRFKIVNFGHDAAGALLCRFAVSSIEEVRVVHAWLSREMQNGELHLETPFFYAGDFLLHPQGSNNKSYCFDDAYVTNVSAWLRAMDDEVDPRA